MALRKTLTVSITSEQDVFVRGQMAFGRFASASEVVRAALQLLSEREQRYVPRFSERGETVLPAVSLVA